MKMEVKNKSKSNSQLSDNMVKYAKKIFTM
jgi:hypothetical protein